MEDGGWRLRDEGVRGWHCRQDGPLDRRIFSTTFHRNANLTGYDAKQTDRKTRIHDDTRGKSMQDESIVK